MMENVPPLPVKIGNLEGTKCLIGSSVYGIGEGENVKNPIHRFIWLANMLEIAPHNRVYSETGSIKLIITFGEFFVGRLAQHRARITPLDSEGLLYMGRGACSLVREIRPTSIVAREPHSISCEKYAPWSGMLALRRSGRSALGSGGWQHRSGRMPTCL